jgi:hypothetical protein
MSDVWNGKRLPERSAVQEDIHYRIYDLRTGELLSFGSSNLLDAVAADIIRTRAEHPHAVLNVVQFDGPAYQ